MAWRFRRLGEEEEKPTLPLTTILRRLIVFLKPYWKHILGYLVLSLIFVAIRIVVPLIAGLLVDALTSMDLEKFNMLLLAYLGISLLRFGVTSSRQVISAYVGQSVIRDIREKLYEKILFARLDIVRGEELGRLASKVTNDVDTFGEVFTSDLINVFMDIFMMLITAWVMVTLNLQLSLIVFLLVPVVLAVNTYFAGRARKAFTKAREAIAKVMAKVEQGVSGAAVTKVFVRRKDYEREEFKKVSSEYVQSNIEAEKAVSGVGPAVQFIQAVGTAAIIYIGALLVLEGKTTIGIIIAFISYLNNFFQPLQTLVIFYNTFQSTLAASERIISVLDFEEEDRGGDKEEVRKGDLDVIRVNFGYEREIQILKNVSFTARPGEITVIAGPTGSGKSTLLKLIPRFYDPWSGEIRIDESVNREYNLYSLRKKVVYVPQEPLIFSGTVLENITSFVPVDRKEVEDLVDMLGIRGIIETIPGGLEGKIVEGGKNLSKGQRQAISLLRAVASKPRLLLLDEATSSIDPETEKNIYKGLNRIVKMLNINLVVVAHRLPAIAPLATRILVLEDGKIREVGRHEDLLSRGGAYLRLWKSQV